MLSAERVPIRIGRSRRDALRGVRRERAIPEVQSDAFLKCPSHPSVMLQEELQLVLPALVQSEISGDGEPAGARASPRELIVGVALGEGVAEVEGDV